MHEVLERYLTDKITLTTADVELIGSVCIVKKLRKKQYLLQEGDVWKYNAFVAKGCMRTYSVNEKGLEHVINFGIENWWIGDRVSLLSGEPSRFNIDAVEDSEVVLITKDNFEMLCKAIPVFNDLVNAIMNKSFAASQNRIHAAISFSAEDKYLDFVKRYPGLANRIPQAMIASYLGITPETLSRVRTASARK
ncbi:Crp/Fnr family transcriptional regulator [Mucilaginibacter daejeonensis]|uniref:Crp/Fnr family transcriptional regulator n=1 Tax=Mucilaginibacter daejeonensis TaxID=398049 RepID=UPI001D1723DE|nr:Crp/Fnr family transcriptional regulator [Mucilaginibacter daejeonensis]UEG53753.1 Crp/Fnr family transcriptional regulator [Mucilaginibacter daejeonensis]